MPASLPPSAPPGAPPDDPFDDPFDEPGPPDVDPDESEPESESAFVAPLEESVDRPLDVPGPPEEPVELASLPREVSDVCELPLDPQASMTPADEYSVSLSSDGSLMRTPFKRSYVTVEDNGSHIRPLEQQPRHSRRVGALRMLGKKAVAEIDGRPSAALLQERLNSKDRRFLRQIGVREG